MSKQKAHQKLNQLTAVLMMAAAGALAAPAPHKNQPFRQVLVLRGRAIRMKCLVSSVLSP